jgi:hypothetical protein
VSDLHPAAPGPHPAAASDFYLAAVPPDRVGPVAGHAPPPAPSVQWSPQPVGHPPPSGAPHSGPGAPYPPPSGGGYPGYGGAYAAPDPRGDGAGWAWILLVAALVFLASAGWFAYQRSQVATDDPGTSTAPGGGAPAVARSAAAWPACAEVFVPGEVIDTEQALAPCRDPDGGLKAVGNFRCADGRRLFQVDANTGARAGWGFGGTAYRETADAASDRDYAAAYRACTA